MNKYKLMSDVPLASGGEGKVYVVTKAEGAGEGETFIMKTRLCCNLEDANNGLSEALALARFQSDYIVHFEDIFIHKPPDDPENNYYVCIVMEHCDGGNLLDYLLQQNSSSTTPSPTTSNSNSTPPSPSSSSSPSPSPSPRTSSSTSTPDASLKNSNKNPAPPSPKTTVPNPFATASHSDLSPHMSLSNHRRSSTDKRFASLSSFFLTSLSSFFDARDSASLPSIVLTPSTSSSDLSLDRENLPRDFLIEWMRQLCNGVQAIHSAKLIHRDLKSENIFLSTNNTLKIGDFGLATLHKNEKIKGIAGTYNYSSPELLRDKLYDRAGDIFSLGCIFYEMTTLQLLPVKRVSFGALILNKTFSPDKVLADFPEDMKDVGELVLQMLQEDPSLRPHIDTILKNSIFASTGDSGGSFSVDKVYTSNNTKLAESGHVIRQLLLSDKKAFAGVMGRAYLNDPLFEMENASKEHHQKVLSSIFAVLFKHFQLKRFSMWGYFNKHKQLLAASVWIPPDHDNRAPSFTMVLQTVFASKHILSIGIGPLRRFKKILTRVDKVVEKSSWHLIYGGVEPDYQSRQIGEHLLRPVLLWADQEGTQATGCIFNERGIHFLQKLGFVIETVQRPEKEPAMWYFKRAPAKK